MKTLEQKLIDLANRDEATYGELYRFYLEDAPAVFEDPLTLIEELGLTPEQVYHVMDSDKPLCHIHDFFYIDGLGHLVSAYALAKGKYAPYPAEELAFELEARGLTLADAINALE